jgi:hypothetical protein
MTLIIICAIIFYYIVLAISKDKMNISGYISEIYLFVVANNVGYIKRFAGL